MQPSRQVCPICAHDEARVFKVDDDWVMSCEDQCHPLYEWRPAGQHTRHLTYRNGLGHELGVYDTLLECVGEDLVEYGVGEHRCAAADPAAYKVLVERYGHRAVRPSKYTASSFRGGALGQLWQEKLVTGTWDPATGYWSYNREVGCYAIAGTSEGSPFLSWEEYAMDTLNVPARDWPVFGHVHAEQL